MGSTRHYEDLLRRFVDYLNHHDFEPLAPDHIPAGMRGPAHEVMTDWFSRKILPSETNPWFYDLGRSCNSD